ncbi:MAG: AgmX/PglI C-terminal domain-containing protein [Bacteriovoracaceae bacterium]
MQLKVKIFNEKTKSEQSLTLEGGPFLVGRGPHCSIQLNDNSISKIHAMITIHNGQVTLTDLYSLNGSWLNEFKITEAIITSVDVVVMGHFHVQFEALESTIHNSDKTQELNLYELGFLTPEETTLKHLNQFENSEYTANFHPLDERLPELDVEDFANSGPSILSPLPGKSLEVTIMVGDDIENIYYLDLNNQEYFFSNKKGLKNTLYIAESAQGKNAFAKTRGEEVELFFLTGARLFDLGGNKSYDKSVQIERSRSYLYDFGVTKVFIRLSAQPPKVLPNRFFENDKLMNRFMGSVAVIMLLLLFISPWMKVPVVQEVERVVAVIYKEVPVVEEKKVEGSSGAAPKVAQTQTQKPSGQKAFKAAGLLSSMNKLLASSNSVSDVTASAPGKSNTDVTMAQGGGRTPASLGGGEVSGTGLAGGNGQKDVGSGLGGGGNKRGMLVGDVATRTVVLGSIDPDLLRKILQEYLPQFRHCYQKELDKNSTKIKGVIDLEFTIGKSGGVVKTNVRARDSGFSNDGIGCLSSVLRVIKFPEPKGGGIVDVRQPLNFYSEDSKS